jgi:hypothetical protein
LPPTSVGGLIQLKKEGFSRTLEKISIIQSALAKATRKLFCFIIWLKPFFLSFANLQLKLEAI